MAKDVFLYQRTDSIGLKGISKNGASREFTGKNSNFYGQGAYTTFSLGATEVNKDKAGLYGRIVVKFKLLGGLKDFLIFDPVMNDYYNNGEPIEQQVRRLCPPDVIQKLERHGYFSNVLGHMPPDMPRGGFLPDGSFTKKVKRTAPQARHFFTILMGNRIPYEKMTPAQKDMSLKRGGLDLCDEIDIQKTKVRGYVFRGENDGDVCMVRNYAELLPVAYRDEQGNWHDIKDVDLENNIRNRADAAFNIQGHYPETPASEKVHCGFFLVKKNGKYNYVDMKTKKELLPVFADFAAPFNDITKIACFQIGKHTFWTNGKTFSDEDSFSYDNQEEFIEMLREEGIINESRIKTINLIETQTQNILKEEMGNNTIKLTESELKGMINEIVKNILKEDRISGDWNGENDDYARERKAAQKLKFAVKKIYDLFAPKFKGCEWKSLEHNPDTAKILMIFPKESINAAARGEILFDNMLNQIQAKVNNFCINGATYNVTKGKSQDGSKIMIKVSLVPEY